MLTISFVISALSLSAFASPTPAAQGGIRIPLSRRVDPSNNGTVNHTTLQNNVQNTICKIEESYEKFRNGAGSDIGVSCGNATSKFSKRANAPLALTAQNQNNDPLWSGPITVGTPALAGTPQGFVVEIDTGSADLFIPDVSCTVAPCQNHNKYTATASTTSTDLQRTFSLTYNGGNVVGEQYTDSVGIAGNTATGQTLGSATTYPSGLSKTVFTPDGVLGFAFQGISKLNARPLFQTLFAQGQITAPIFGIKLAQTGSELYLGGTDTALYTGAITYTSVMNPTGATAPGFWQVTLDGFLINGSRIRGLSGLTSIIDTGSPYIVASTRQVQLFYRSIPGSKEATAAGSYTIPCNSVPTVSLTFGGRSFPINPSLFNLGPVTAGSSECLGAVVGGGSSDYWVVGDTFLQNVYSVFDATTNANANPPVTPRVGFATLA